MSKKTKKPGKDKAPKKTTAAAGGGDDGGQQPPEQPPHPKHILTCDVQTTLHVTLSDVEAAARATEAAQLGIDIDRREDEFSDLKRRIKAEINAVKKRQRELGKIAIAKKESQKVECTQTFDLKKRETFYTYRDVEYERRPMTNDEWERCVQKPLFEDGPDLPNRVRPVAPVVSLEVVRGGKEESAAATAGDELAKKADDVYKLKPADGIMPDAEAKPVRVPDVEPEPGEGNATTSDDIRDVMRDETKRGGKKDHTT